MRFLNTKLFKRFVIISLALLLVIFIFEYERNKFVSLYEVKLENNVNSKSPFEIYIYLNKESCSNCLDIIPELKSIKNISKIIILPKEEKKKLKMYRHKFELRTIVENEELHRIRPEINPSVLIIYNEKIIAVIPAFPTLSEYIKEIIYGLYQKLN